MSKYKTIDKSLILNFIKKNFLGEKFKIVDINKVNSGHSINSNNFIITIRNEEIIKKMVLKIKSNYNENDYKILKINKYLYKKGVKVPKIINTIKNQLCVIKDKKLFVMFEYYSGIKFKHIEKEIFSAAKNLALLNNELKGLDITIERNSRYDDLTNEELKRIKRLSNLENDFENKVLTLSDGLPLVYQNLNSKLGEYFNKRQLVYLDYHPKNVLFDSNQVQVILDLDSIVIAPELQSIAFGLDRFCKTKKEKMKFIKGYCSQNPCLKNKVNLLPFFIQREALYRINYILRSHYFYNCKDWNFELDKHLKIIAKTRASIKLYKDLKFELGGE
ncbi:MAG: phosphotransferase [Bacillota bacterium]